MRFLRLAVALCALERVRSATTYENPVYAHDHPDPGVLWDPASEVRGIEAECVCVCVCVYVCVCV